MPRAHKKRRSNFWRGYLIYVAALLVLLFALFLYVRGVMVEYENSVPEKFILTELKKGGKVSSFLDKNLFNTEYGKDQSAVYSGRLNTSDIEIKHSVYAYDSTKPVFNVLADGKPLLTVGLSQNSSKTKLGAIVIPKWDVDSCVLRSEDSPAESIRLNKNGRIDHEIYLPEGFTLVANGQQVPEFTAAEKTDIKDFAYIKDYVSVPQMLRYDLTDSCIEASWTALNNAGTAIYGKENGKKIEFAPAYAESAEAKSLINSIGDPLEMGKIWSKFMTNDVGGESHGLKTVRSECRLLQGTQLYTLATNWAKSVDVSFVSVHTLKGFTNEKVSNFVKYNDNFASCDVYFEKNMVLKTGAKRTDVFNNRMCFIRISDKSVAQPGWYLADIISIQ